MVKSIPVPDSVMEVAQEALDSFLTGTMTVYRQLPYTNPDTGITEFKLTPVLQDIPCRLGYQDKQPATENEPARAEKASRVITTLEYNIPAGSVFEITFRGVTDKYKQSGRPHRNDFRQSIPIEIYEEHAVSYVYEGENEWVV